MNNENGVSMIRTVHIAYCLLPIACRLLPIALPAHEAAVAGVSSHYATLVATTKEAKRGIAPCVCVYTSFACLSFFEEMCLTTVTLAPRRE